MENAETERPDRANEVTRSERRRRVRDGPPDAAEIRDALTSALIACGEGPGIVVHELGLRKGQCRADVAVIAAKLHGYEIKIRPGRLGAHREPSAHLR